MNLLSKKGVTVGTIDFEFGVTYGSFGYGQSYQLKTDMYTTQEYARISMLPRLFPSVGDASTMYRGTCMHPRKLKHPPFIPVISEPVEDFEPDEMAAGADGCDNPAVESPNFPLMKQHLQRLGGLMNLYSAQTSRSRRMCFLRKLLQSDIGEVDDEFEETNADPGKPAPVPPALAIMMNTARFIQHAPGIVRDR